MPQPSRRRGRGPCHGRLAALLAALTVGAGCSAGATSQLALLRDNSIAKPLSEKEMGDSPNFLSRWLNPKAPGSNAYDEPDALGRPREGFGARPVKADPAADAEFREAEQLFQQGDLARAEAAFARIARKRKDTPWGEKAQYYLAETRYQRGNYVGAHDAFEELFKDYQATAFLEKAIKREFEIGERWLAYYDPKSPDSKIPWYARFTGRLPYVAPGGNAVAVLEHVRHHDPLGPHSDDAVMRIADYHKASQDYETAAVYYDQLIQFHPKSPLLQKAQHEAIDSRMKAYLGPDFDGTPLEEARQLVRQTMATFPDKAEANKDLYHTLDLINDQDAERNYRVGTFYRRLGRVASAEYYFGKVLRHWPESDWGKKSKDELAVLAKMPRTKSLPSKIMTTPGSPDPMSQGASPNGGMMGGGGMPGMGQMGP